jgi:glycosyltransferase involved in cell wall biosynthesis
MRVLYVNHTAHVSGGERSLLTLIDGLPATVEPIVACPPGALAEAVASRGIDAQRITRTDGSLSPHPTRTPRALAELTVAGLNVRRIAGDNQADLIHANSIRAGLSTALARGRSRLPTLVHVRDCLPPSRLSAASLGVIDRCADAIVANSEHTRSNLLGVRAPTRVVHNAVDLERFSPSPNGRGQRRARLGLDERAVVLAMVAQITPWKAQDDAIRIVAGLASRVPELRLLIVGSPKFASASTRFDNTAYLERLEAMVADEGLQEVVRFLGERDDVAEILRASDLLLAPSWEEPFGRAIVEAMATAVPAAATAVGGPREILTDGREGLLLPPRRPDLWIEAIEPLLANPERLRAMGARSREAARARFGVQRHVDSVVQLYQELMATAAIRR